MFQLDIHSKYDYNLQHIVPQNQVQSLQKKKVIVCTSLNCQQKAYFCPNLELYIFKNLHLLSKSPY
jgi:hypothetical protein